MLEEEIFKKSDFLIDKLQEYGFIWENGTYIYKENILDNSFQVVITIKNNKLKGKIIDLDLEEEYLNYRVENQIGEFNGKIREKYINILNNIKSNCTLTKYFISNQSNRITKYIIDKYKTTPEFLFDEATTGVFRNNLNKKWFGIIMYIDYEKLVDKKGKVEVLDIKLNPEEVTNLLNENGFYKAYHMKKKFWLSITLDDTVPDEVIENLIDKSYNFTVDTNTWVIPANPKYFDIESYMENKEVVEWKMTSNIKVDDIVYIYIASPISAIMYKTQAVEIDIESSYDSRKSMLLKILTRYPKEKYTFNIIKKYDLTAIRGPRKVPKKLLDKMKEDEENEES